MVCVILNFIFEAILDLKLESRRVNIKRRYEFAPCCCVILSMHSIIPHSSVHCQPRFNPFKTKNRSSSTDSLPGYFKDTTQCFEVYYRLTQSILLLFFFFRLNIRCDAVHRCAMFDEAAIWEADLQIICILILCTRIVRHCANQKKQDAPFCVLQYLSREIVWKPERLQTVGQSSHSDHVPQTRTMKHKYQLEPQHIKGLLFSRRMDFDFSFADSLM